MPAAEQKPDKISVDETGQRFLKIFWLMPGVSKTNATTYFISAFLFVSLVTFLNFVQPYVLEVILKIPKEQQGSVTGNLNFLHEGTAFIIMGLVGAVSDRTGRRALIITGFLIWSIGFLLFPTADSVMQLYAYRLIFAVGVATASVMVIATMQDYPQEASRGKWGGFNSFLTSFAILVVLFVLAPLPGRFAAAGSSPEEAGMYTYWVGAVLCVIAAVIFRFGFPGGRIAKARAEGSAFSGIVEAFSYAKRNPRLGLTYIAAFAARGDMVVVGAFYSLWFVRAGADQGIDAGEAIRIGAQTMGALIIANVIWAPIFGYLLDRMNRIVGLAIAMTLAAIGYYVIGTVSDPYNMGVMATATFILGVGEISAIVTGNALLGQEAPPRIRGAASGVFGLVGTLGILCATVVGGRVFDAFGYSAPFTMMAFVNAAVAVLAILLIVSGRHHYQQHAAEDR